MSETYSRVIVDIVYKEEVNKNNWLLPKETLKKELSKMHCQIDRGHLYILPTYTMSTDPADFLDVPVQDALGNVISIDIDNRKATIRLKDSFIEQTETFDLGLYFFFIGNKLDFHATEGYNTITEIQIPYVVLQPKSLSAYSTDEKGGE